VNSYRELHTFEQGEPGYEPLLSRYASRYNFTTVRADYHALGVVIAKISRGLSAEFIFFTITSRELMMSKPESSSLSEESVQKQPGPKHFGSGWISGTLSIVLASIGLFAVLCFHFPS